MWGEGSGPDCSKRLLGWGPDDEHSVATKCASLTMLTGYPSSRRHTASSIFNPWVPHFQAGVDPGGSKRLAGRAIPPFVTTSS